MEGDDSSQAESAGTQPAQADSIGVNPFEIDSIKCSIRTSGALPAELLMDETKSVNWFGEGASTAKDRL